MSGREAVLGVSVEKMVIKRGAIAGEAGLAHETTPAPTPDAAEVETTPETGALPATIVTPEIIVAEIPWSANIEARDENITETIQR